MTSLPAKIFAHRGASKLAPENTMAAFELAYELGAEGIETDVHLTKDHVPVLIHDEHIKRTTNGVGYIKDYTFEQLKQFDAGSWFSNEFAGEKIIALEDFLKWSKSKPLQLNIELKNNKIDYKNLESIVYEMMEHYQLLDRTILSTFNASSIKRLKKFNNQIEVAYLTSKRNRNLVRHATELGANTLHIKYRLLKSLLIEQARQEDMTVRVYTINKLAHMSHCFTQGCDGIITDLPDQALELRKQFHFK